MTYADKYSKEQKSERVVPVDLRDNRFQYSEAHLIPEPFPVTHGSGSHSHTQSAASVTREDIEQAKRQSIQMPPPDGIREDLSESASASVSTAMHHMIDGLVDSEMPDDQQPVLHLTPFAPGPSDPTPMAGPIDVSSGASHREIHQQHSTLTAQDVVDQMLRSHDVSTTSLGAPNMEREQTMRPSTPSLSETPFTPSLREMHSPQSRPTTSHKVLPDNSTPIPLSSGSAFEHGIFKRQQQLQMQSTPVHSPLPSSSWFYSEGPNGTYLPPLQSSPWTVSTATGTPPPIFDGDEIPRKAPPPAMFGAIGQTPPSAQAG